MSPTRRFTPRPNDHAERKENVMPTQVTESQDTDRFIPYGPANTELEWFFTQSDSDMGDHSNFAASIARVDLDTQVDTIDKRVEAAHAQRTILKWLRELDDFDAGVLQAAYVARPWPLTLREELGRLTGVVVRLAVVDIGLPEDDDDRRAAEERTANQLDEALASGEQIVSKLLLEATSILRRAYTAYVRERGGMDKAVLKGVS